MVREESYGKVIRDRVGVSMGHPRETPSRGLSVGGRALEADTWP